MSTFNPSANVEALLGGYRTGESAVHTGLALAHQRQSNMLMSARMAHYEALDEARQRGIDIQQKRENLREDEADRKTKDADRQRRAYGRAMAIAMDDSPGGAPAPQTPSTGQGAPGSPGGSMGPSIEDAAALDALMAQRRQQETTRAADTARTALNMGQPLGGGMIGAGSVLAPEPQPGMGPGLDEGGASPVGTGTVLAPEPPPAPALENGPGAIGAGAPKQSADPSLEEQHAKVDSRYHRALTALGPDTDPGIMAQLRQMRHEDHAEVDSRAKAAENKAYKDARIGQFGQGLDIQGRKADQGDRRLGQQADQFDQRLALEKDRFGNTVRHEGVTEAEQKRRQDYLEKTYGASGNKLDHDLSSLLNNGSRDQLRAQLREKSATGAPTKVALRLATMMREVGMDPDEERLLGDKDEADEKYDALKDRPSTGWDSSPEYKNAARANKALGDYYAKPKPQAAAAPKASRLPTPQELSELNRKYSDKTPDEVQAIWEREHAGGS